MIEALFTVATFELFVGGGGRLLELGPMTVRMLLFAACLAVSVLAILFQRRKHDAVPLALGLAAVYLVVHLFALLVGGLKGANTSVMTTEMQQSLYWLAAPFLAIVLETRTMVHRAANLVMVAGVVLAAAYMLALLAFATGALDFFSIYERLNATGEFFFRGESLFFYKGFVYLGIAAIFFTAIQVPHRTIFLILVLCALGLTLTRGFVLATTFAVGLLLIDRKRWTALFLASAAAAAVAFFVWIYMPSMVDGFSEQRDISSNQRVDDAIYIAEHFQTETLLIGEGFGSLINNRVSIENTFLWVQWKLGLAGVVFWLSPLLLCAIFYYDVARRHRGDRAVAAAFFYGVVLVYVQTLSNPYLNNPIGLSFVLIALFSLRTLSHGASEASADSKQRSLPVRSVQQ